jgi:hypothetical protein
MVDSATSSLIGWDVGIVRKHVTGAIGRHSNCVPGYAAVHALAAMEHWRATASPADRPLAWSREFADHSSRSGLVNTFACAMTRVHDASSDGCPILSNGSQRDSWSALDMALGVELVDLVHGPASHQYPTHPARGCAHVGTSGTEGKRILIAVTHVAMWGRAARDRARKGVPAPVGTTAQPADK